ncbi:MAG: hypothetical protein ABI823_10585 [Bryobacteraceae bacterium]
MFLLSPLDWVLIEHWKNSGVPLEAVLRGIDAAFEKWQTRRNRTQMVNSIAYCTQAVTTEAKAMAEGIPVASKQPAPPFSLEDLQAHLERTANALRALGIAESADSLDHLRRDAEVHYRDLEQLEQRLTALEDKLVASIRTRATEEQLFAARRDVDSQIRPYRSKMSAEQLSMLERQLLERRLLEDARLPRLSLFYLR